MFSYGVRTAPRVVLVPGLYRLLTLEVLIEVSGVSRRIILTQLVFYGHKYLPLLSIHWIPKVRGTYIP
jgi:hypothetical protein